MYLPPNLVANSIADTICLIIAVILILASATSLILSAAIWRLREFLFNLVPFVVDLILFHAVYDACSAIARRQDAASVFGRLIMSLDVRAELILGASLLVIALLRVWNMTRMVRTQVTIFSVGDALEDLPAGVLFASRGGQVVQANRAMEDLNYELTEDALLDSERFWRRIRQRADESVQENISGSKNEARSEVRSVLTGTTSHLVRMEDGISWEFRRSLRKSSVMDFWQITATDVTEELRLNDEYQVRVEQLAAVNRRLRHYSDVVDETVRREELLEAKKRMHDNMGTVLLATRMFLENEDAPVTAEQLLQQWRADLELLREEAREERTDPLQRFRDVAEYLGLALEIDGTIPDDPEIRELMLVGLQECLTNAVSHGRAQRLTVTIRQTESEAAEGRDTAKGGFSGTEIRYENDGAPAEHPIREGGGLSILRKKAVAFGASLDYPESEGFCLRVRVAK